MTHPALSQTFAQVRLLTDDFQSSYCFYTDVLGLTQKDAEHDLSDGPYAAFTVGTTDVAIFTRQYLDASIGAEHLPRGAADHVVIVLRVDDVDAAYQEAEKRGATTVAAPRDMEAWHMRVAHLRAPEGTLIELCSYDD
jgi:predicted enzyme related to lactoylglutathione lyase